MKRNFNIPFTDYNGNPVKENNQILTIGRSLSSALFQVSKIGNSPLSENEKYAAYSLSRQLMKAEGDMEISVDEALLIKRVAYESYSAGGYGQIVDLIEEK